MELDLKHIALIRGLNNITRWKNGIILNQDVTSGLLSMEEANRDVNEHPNLYHIPEGDETDKSYIDIVLELGELISVLRGLPEDLIERFFQIKPGEIKKHYPNFWTYGMSNESQNN